ncbi:hypothetical protein Psi01_59780 [Planobispora siamensis]|uniref:Uncharacterized protein n=2 Tax=Planobispora siamensis TaxID=936338 RepID=A0A8J3SJ51_9ACTN|nr:hypothetical protein Psi01_59780 [Planobispora siamensis]
MVDDDPALALLWQPYCWARGYHVPHHSDAWFETCATCERLLWEQKGEQARPAWLLAQRVPTSWRRWLRMGT